MKNMMTTRAPGLKRGSYRVAGLQGYRETGLQGCSVGCVTSRGVWCSTMALSAILALVLCLGGATLFAQENATIASTNSIQVSLPVPAAVSGQPDSPVVKSEDRKPGRTRLLSECDDIPGLAKPFNFKTPDQMDVVKFITMLSDQVVGGDLNLIISPQVKGSVKLMLTGVTIADAMEIALADNSLAYEVKGNGPRSIIKIMTEDEYRARFGVAFYEQRKVRMIELKYAKPTSVLAMLDGMKSQIGKIIADDKSGTVVLIDTPARISEMESLIERAELPTLERHVPTASRVFRLQYADLVEVQKEVTASLTKEVGTMVANTKTKTLIVSDLAHNLEKISTMIEAFDRKPKQVIIDAKIVEVDLTDDFNMGINWKHVIQGIGPRFNLASVAPLSAGVSPQITYNTIISGGGDLTVVVDALKTVGETKVISNPHISVLDGGEATIKVVRNQPYKEISFESGTTNIVGVSYKFVDIGTTLSVSPLINDLGFITVNIKPTISDLVDWYDAPGGSGGVVGIPVVKKSEAATSVTVKDGVTIIIGGMIKTEKRINRTGIPILGSIPLLGRLFRSDVEKNAKSETIVFLTPRIISGEEPFLQSPDENRDLKLRE